MKDEMAAEQPIAPYGDGQRALSIVLRPLGRWTVTSPRPIVNTLGRTRWLQSRQHRAPPRGVKYFRQTCPHASPTGALKNFLSHLFVDRQLNLPVVLRVGTAVISHGRQEANCSTISLWNDPALRY